MENLPSSHGDFRERNSPQELSRRQRSRRVTPSPPAMIVQKANRDAAKTARERAKLEPAKLAREAEERKREAARQASERLVKQAQEQAAQALATELYRQQNVTHDEAAPHTRLRDFIQDEKRLAAAAVAVDRLKRLPETERVKLFPSPKNQHIRCGRSCGWDMRER
jgi:hypothetical protein